MTNDEAKEKLRDFMEQCEVDGDSYFCLHISKSDDCADAVHNIDILDAMILIKNLVRDFNIHPSTVSAMLDI